MTTSTPGPTSRGLRPCNENNKPHPHLGAKLHNSTVIPVPDPPSASTEAMHRQVQVVPLALSAGFEGLDKAVQIMSATGYGHS